MRVISKGAVICVISEGALIYLYSRDRNIMQLPNRGPES
jgi:hypothetical protein